MTNTMGLLILFSVIGALVLMAAYRFMIQRRQMTSGREVGRFQLIQQDGKFVFDQQIDINQGGRWCRLVLQLSAQAAYQLDRTPRYLFKRFALVVGNPYTLIILDGSNRELYREEDTLTRFVTWFGSRGGETSTLVSERGQAVLNGRVAFLEFFANRAGAYRIVLEIQTRAEDQAPGASSHWEVLEAGLTVQEGVEPLSQIVKYPHKHVHL